MAGDETDEYMDDPQNSAYVSLGAVLGRDDSFRDLLETPAPCAYARDAETFVMRKVQGAWLVAHLHASNFLTPSAAR